MYLEGIILLAISLGTSATVCDHIHDDICKNQTHPCDLPTINFTIVDAQIVEGLVHPVHDNNSEVISLSQYFYTEMDDLADVIEEDKARGSRLMEILDLKKKPVFMNVELDVTALKMHYGWTGNDFDELGNNMQGTRVAWRRIQKVLSTGTSE